MISRSLIKKFEEIVGRENLFGEKADLLAYSYDASTLNQIIPELVLRPTKTELLGKIAALCDENRLPLTMRGAGSNLSGGTIPCTGGIVVLSGALNRVLEINVEDMYVRTEPGVITASLAQAAEAEGLFYPPDPGSMSISTLGGNVAENAGGLRGLKYGVTRDYVMGMTFFGSRGQKIKTGSKTVKCVTGYNIGGLLTGSEGTLGIISEITLKLIPPPAFRKSMIAVFNRLDKASEAVAAIIAKHIVPATLEIMDNFTIRAVEDYSKVGLPVEAAALLLIELDGHQAQVEEEAERAEALCRKLEAVNIKVAQNTEERDKIWEARRGALSALAKLKPTLVLEDATVPRSRVPELVSAIQEIGRKYDLDIGTFGHAGDGNLHPTILTDKRNKSEWKRVEAAVEAIFDKALSMGGTLSGEHGVGRAKSAFLEREIGKSGLLSHQQIKAALDPNNILNPGKIIDV
jgi:glycolate oxidase